MSTESPITVGVDGCAAGWVAMTYAGAIYGEANRYEEIGDLWAAFGEDADTILIDIPIGLREDSNEPRPCDTAARKKLSPLRHSSVFPPPVRSAVHQDSYEAAKAEQEAKTDGSLGAQAWGIASKIRQLDTFLRETKPETATTIREAHPEVCFWALNDETPTQYSKTSQPAAAYWERLGILKEIDGAIIERVRAGSSDLDTAVGNDDIVDAFALAVTASPLTGDLEALPSDQSPDDTGDPKGLSMEIVYAYP